MAAIAMATAAGCTQRNARYCGDGVCIDPAYPFCDVNGMFGDLRQQCVAVDCTPDAFVACRGADELRCNATGTNYDVTRCELGCDAAGGCRLCEPNQTACTNGKMATCDAAGNVISSEACPLGCFEDQPRCRELDPSNGLAMFADMVPNPPDLDLTDAVFLTDTGVVTQGAVPLAIPSFLIPAAGTGTPVRVFIANNLRLQNATFTAAGDPRDPPGPAIAFVVRKDILLDGLIKIEPRAGGAMTGCLPAGSGGLFYPMVSFGGGGGGNATDGADGGAIIAYDGPQGPLRGRASGTSTLEPLRGGCSGGFAYAFTAGSYPNGGGAVQLSSGRRIVVQAEIDARGGGGSGEQDQNGIFIGGGGAGGSLLLEAPTIELVGAAKLLASGGRGAQACATPQPSCSLGGAGAMRTAPAPRVMDLSGNTPPPITSGGGGGGLGVIRFNTRDGTYIKNSAAVEDGALTVGSIRTR